MNYRLAKESDIEAVCDIVKSAIAEMENKNIFQWDTIYPTRDDFLVDIKKRQLYVGELQKIPLIILKKNFGKKVFKQ